jgi:cell division protein FtsB
MEILGVLLGITMSAVGFGAWWLKKEYLFLRNLNRIVEVDDARIMLIERRRPVAAPEAAAQTPAPGPKLRYRTWNEDAVMPEKSN